MNTRYYSNGKLLLTAEYGVLDGALALAVPTKFGQSLEVGTSNTSLLQWQSLDENGEIWFSATFDAHSFTTKSSTDRSLSGTLENILMKAKELNPKFNEKGYGYRLTSKLTFPRNWGLGSSSTLINNIAQWARVDPYKLLNTTFGGSGYDIACAQCNTPIFYQLIKGKPIVRSTTLDLAFKEHLYFVFLNKKQNSREAISNYRKQHFNKTSLVAELTNLTKRIPLTTGLDDFESLLSTHEALLSRVLGIQPVKAKMFPDYFGTLKSLGGWGGDFILATGNQKTPDYFKAKGFDVVIPYADMVL